MDYTTEELRKYLIDLQGWRFFRAPELGVIIGQLRKLDRLEERWNILKKWADNLNPIEQISASALQTELAD